MVSKPRTTQKGSKTRKTSPKTKSKAKTTKTPKVVAEGDFILVDLVGRTHEEKQLFETTKENVAKAEGVYSEEEAYQPRLVVIGQGFVVPGLEAALIGMKVKETKQLVLEPQNAFGVRDPQQVRILPRARIKSDQKLVRGMRVRIGNQTGTIRHVGGGRVTVDFNPPLAGHTVEYEVTLKKILTKAQEKIDAFLRRRFYGVDPELVTASARGKTVTINIAHDPRILLNQSLQIQKLGVTHDIETYMKGKYSKVLFIEEWGLESSKPESKP
jgi:FKBP-type peptidyl-prolyl cis-trans isomerase 2